MHKWQRLLVLPAAVGLLSGCGAGANDVAEADSAPEVVTVTNVTTVVETPPATPEAPTEEEAEEATEQPSESSGEPAQQGAVDANANKKFSEASPVPVAILLSPTENIACDIGDTYLTCRISSWTVDAPHGEMQFGPDNTIPYNSVSITDGEVTIGAASDVLMSMAHANPDSGYEPYPQILQYGETISHHHYSCTSTFDAMICQDTLSGAGASISRAGADIF